MTNRYRCVTLTAEVVIMTGWQWRKSTFSFANGNCTEVAVSEAGILVRDTLDRGGPVLTFSAAAWTAFCHRLVS